MPALQSPPAVTFQIAEDGEAIGTVQQFADHLNVPPPRVVSCLREADVAPVVLDDAAADPLLIVGAEGVDALLHCAADRVLA